MHSISVGTQRLRALRAVGLDHAVKTADRRANVLHKFGTCDGPKVMLALFRAASFSIKHLAGICDGLQILTGNLLVKFLLVGVCKRKKSMLWSGRWFWTPMLMKPRLQTRRMHAAQSVGRFSGLIHFATLMAHLASRYSPVQATAHSIRIETAATKVLAWTSFPN